MNPVTANNELVGVPVRKSLIAVSPSGAKHFYILKRSDG